MCTYHYITAFFSFFILMAGCNDTGQKNLYEASVNSAPDTLTEEVINTPATVVPVHPLDTLLVNVMDLDTSFKLDIRYATKNNFTGEQLYSCMRCYLNKEAAEALIKVHQQLKQKGYGIKLFDCYRPHSVQERMWEITPNKIYVADPAKGSMHNRGLAVDLTLVDSTGKQLEMGTAYDFFGRKAHPGYKKLPENVLQNRQVLRQAMIKGGFNPINSEWWHYNFKTPSEIYDLEFPCN